MLQTWRRQWTRTTGTYRLAVAQRHNQCALVGTSSATIAAPQARKKNVSDFRVGVLGLGAIGTIFFTRLGRLATVSETRKELPILSVDALIKVEQFNTWVKKKKTATMQLVHDGQETETLEFQVLTTADKVATACNASNVRVCALGGSTGEPHDGHKLDVLLVTVKAHDSVGAIQSLRERHRHLLKNDALCVLLQNGLGEVPTEENRERIDNRWQIVSGVTFVGGRVLEFAKVKTSGLEAGKTYVAPLHRHGAETGLSGLEDTMTMPRERDDVKMQMLVDVLVAAGIHCKVLGSNEMQAMLWHKLIINAAINPLASLLNAPNRSVASSESSRRCVHLVVQEALAVAQCEQILLNRSQNELVDDVLEVARTTGSNVCSMLADLRRGSSRTEIDAMTGQIVAGGKRHGIPTPTNELLLLLIKALEEEREVRQSR
uniref:2-dehydropantoate 2-reductase n=1 Tax=Peronospora matthiolae TaxID=2874970 RepID=A0AAV1UTG5_9STRA